MTLTTTADLTVAIGRPAYEGANIRTWIGFKHFLYLVEQALLEWLRDQGSAAGRLYLDHGLGFEIVDCSVQLPAVLDIDDEVRAEVRRSRGDRLAVTLSVLRDGTRVTVLRGTVTVALVRERDAAVHRPAPPGLAGLEVAELAVAAGTAPPPRRLPHGTSVESVLGGDPSTLVWSWRAPYYYCHFSDRVQHSGFVRALEEVVDRYLDDRGISVGRMLAERDWIPVVSRVRVRLVAAAHLEEVVHTVFTVTDILRGMLFDGRMECYVARRDELVPVAVARILHGYAVAAGPGAGGMAQLDAEVSRALTGGRS